MMIATASVCSVTPSPAGGGCPVFSSRRDFRTRQQAASRHDAVAPDDPGPIVQRRVREEDANQELHRDYGVDFDTGLNIVCKPGVPSSTKSPPILRRPRMREARETSLTKRIVSSALTPVAQTR